MTGQQQRMQGRLSSLASADPIDPKYAALHAEIEDLKAMALSSDIEETPEVQHAGPDIQKVYERLDGQRIADLIKAYNKDYFEKYSAYTRYVIAAALVRLAVKADKEPSTVWTSLVKTTGRM